MDIKFTHILNALAKLRDEVGSDNAKGLVIQATMVPDDPGSGRMIECLTIKSVDAVTPSQYDSYKGNMNREITCEIFAENENRPPRFTVLVSRDLEPKRD